MYLSSTVFQINVCINFQIYYYFIFIYVWISTYIY